MTRKAKPAAPILEGDGEPQTVFMPPAEGGSYRRNPDGSLTRVEHPTKRPDEPATPE